MLSEEPKKIGSFAYFLAGLSFIPLAGIPFGLIAILWGFLRWKQNGKRLILISALGIAFTVALYLAVFYVGFFQRGGSADFSRMRIAEAMLNTLLSEIELYKTTNGHYPSSLKELNVSKNLPMPAGIYDPTKIVGLKKNSLETLFYYELKEGEQKYYLLGTGFDDLPFTRDDLLPLIPKKPGNLGLLIHPDSKPRYQPAFLKPFLH